MPLRQPIGGALRGAQCVKGRLGARKERGCGGGLGDATPAALEQYDAELVLQAAHRLADGGLSDPQRSRGGGEAARPRRRGECLQLAHLETHHIA